MKPIIDQSFWADPDIENAKAGTKLTALWLITNSQTSLIGLCRASVSRFMFETGLPEEALAATLKALPRAFVKVGDVIFVRNYVRHQFGSGEKLMKNNFFVALKSLFLNVKDESLKALILEEYPEFSTLSPKGFEGLSKPKDEKRREEKVRKDKKKGMQGEVAPVFVGQGEDSTPSIEDQAEEIYQAYPRKEAKQTAIEAIIKKLKTHSFELLLTASKRYSIERAGRDQSATPHPATWFNQDRFLEDPANWGLAGRALEQRNQQEARPIRQGRTRAELDAIDLERLKDEPLPFNPMIELAKRKAAERAAAV